MLLNSVVEVTFKKEVDLQLVFDSATIQQKHHQKKVFHTRSEKISNSCKIHVVKHINIIHGS